MEVKRFDEPEKIHHMDRFYDAETKTYSYKNYYPITTTDFDKECDLLKEYLAWKIEQNFQKVIMVHNIMSLFMKTGNLFIGESEYNSYHSDICFEQWKNLIKHDSP